MINKGFQPDGETEALLNAILHPDTDEEGEDALKKAAGLNEDARYYIADQLDHELNDLIGESFGDNDLEEMNRDLMQLEESQKSGVPMPADSELADPEFLEIFKEIFKGFDTRIAFIVETKGDDAGLFAKLFLEETAKLSAHELKLPTSGIRILFNVLTMLNNWPAVEAQRRADKEKALEEERARASAEMAEKRLEKLKEPHRGGIVLKKARP